MFDRIRALFSEENTPETNESGGDMGVAGVGLAGGGRH